MNTAEAAVLPETQKAHCGWLPENELFGQTVETVFPGGVGPVVALVCFWAEACVAVQLAACYKLMDVAG